MKKLIYLLLLLISACGTKNSRSVVSGPVTAEQILGNTQYTAICYGGYRTPTREVEPTVAEIKEDMRILAAMKIKLIRTYNVHHKEISHLLQAITELKQEEKGFEMYVMLGAWIDCKNAWTAAAPVHDQESERNAIEIKEAVRLTNQYPDIVKIIAVGNEAMVKWATSYYVTPGIILKWVNHLQNLKKQDQLPKEVWITSSDNFASWGGGGNEYHVEELTQLMKAVDYLSVHTYPMHDTHYNPAFWGIKDAEQSLPEKEKIDSAMARAADYAMTQYNNVVRYMKSIGVNKQVHIGETGWATFSGDLYGNEGSKATDEYKSARYYKLMRDWTNREGITCFYFEAFDENWKSSAFPMNSENHFGLINLQSQVKFALWDLVDKGVFNGLTRNGKPLTKTYNGNVEALWMDVKTPDRFKKK
jgi:exo-beta-1,3-glucanase (GH17 family)